MKNEKPKFRRRVALGFTLVEITFALGVVGVGFVGLLGLLPVGIQIFRSAVDTSVRSQIVQLISTDATQTDFDTLVTNPPSDRYFDNQGIEVTQQRSIYQVRVQVASMTDLPSFSSTASNSNLATVQIKIANNPSHLADPFSGNNKTSIFKTTTFVARNQ